MQQNETAMQGTSKLHSVRRISIHTDRAHICELEDSLVKKYLGIPYKMMGRDMNGLDCYGLIMSIYKDMGYDLFDISQNYNAGWSFEGKNFFYENYYKEWDIVENPEPLDIVLFHNGMGIANHGGVFLSTNKIIQSCQAGVVIARLYNQNIKNRIEGFYRLRKRNDNY